MTAIRLALILPLLGLSACAQMGVQTTATARPDAAATTAATTAATGAPPSSAAAQQAAAITRAPAPRPAARATVAQLDTVTAAQKAEAIKPAASAETRLGTTIASLGDATQPGLWIKTPLVKEAGIGRIVNPANGKSARVELIPLSGPASGGSQVSLSALQLLGISLTDLPSIEVYRS